jgi:hypothetical protein|tara:strand:+ start:589 stop:945 length:357 start_codon:yes stop_codon:yes gene_type:complete
MATNSTWTVIFEDKMIVNHGMKNDVGHSTGYVINDDNFWGLAKFNNIWAIQYGTSNPSDAVEYRDTTPHSTYEDANLGDFQEFISRWDAAHLAQLQADWDANESPESEKGPRPTSYSS